MKGCGAGTAEYRPREPLAPGEYKMFSRDFNQIAAMLYADAGIYLRG